MSADWEVTDPAFTVLMVCTANICRSPLAERLLQQWLDDVAPGEFRVASAGTHGLTGAAAEPRIAALAERHGASMDGFTARALLPEHIEQADLILTMAREHRRHIVQLVPGALRRTFTLREFARILPGVPGESAARASQRWHSLAALAQRRRRPPAEPRLDDVVDPYGRPARVYHEMAGELTTALDVLVDWERRHSPGER